LKDFKVFIIYKYLRDLFHLCLVLQRPQRFSSIPVNALDLTPDCIDQSEY